MIEKKVLGDSFGYHASNRYLIKKFDNYKFISLKNGIKKYFKWINKVPIKRFKELSSFYNELKKMKKIIEILDKDQINQGLG